MMTTGRAAEDHVIHKRLHSKAFKEGLGILSEEIALAVAWNRPCILLAVHNSISGRADAQLSLEKKIIKKNRRVVRINVESANPDVIRMMSETPNSEDIIFFVSGIEKANQAAEGRVYRALNMRRELLVEKRICAVFWLNESEAANLPRLAPDFWAFRHRVVEFAPKHGTKKQTLPVGLFLWQENIPWMKEDAHHHKISYYEELLMRLPLEAGAASARIETILKLTHLSWHVNDLNKFSSYLEAAIDFLEKYPLPQYQAWALNAKGIGLYEEGNKEDANAYFMKALNQDPTNSAIMMNTAISEHGLGKNRDAILRAQRAVKKNIVDFYLWRVPAYLFLSMGKIDKALQAMKKALDTDPENTEMHYSTALCYFKNEQFDECAMELSKAEKISGPQNPIQQACIGILSGKPAEAFAQLKRSLEEQEITKHHILRDPNLHFLLNGQDFSTPK